VPKSILQIKNFEGGLVNYYDPRDLPDNALHDATGIMCDITGKVRTMGGATEFSLTATTINGHFEAGYGLFAIAADFNTDGDSKACNLIFFQNGVHLNVWDDSIETTADDGTVTAGGIVDRLVTLSHTTNVNEEGEFIKPVFYYVDGGLRIADRTLPSDGFKYPKTVQFIDKTWFGNVGSFHANEGGYKISPKWYPLDSFIFPPSSRKTDNDGQLINTGANYGVLSTATSDTPDAFGKLNIGNIHLEVGTDTSTAGEYQGDSALQFGLSFIMDDGQESPITNFVHTDGTNQVIDTSSVAANHSLKFKIACGFGEIVDDAFDPGSTTSHYAFDPRVAGVVLYWIGDSLGTFADPWYMAHLHFGTSNKVDNPQEQNYAYFESHIGDRMTTFAAQDLASTDGSNNGVKSTNYLVVRRLPAITYTLRTLIDEKEVTTAAQYTCAVVVNRRAYIGGVRRFGFDTENVVGGSGVISDEHEPNTHGNCVKQSLTVQRGRKEFDKMLISNAGQFDIFPGSQEMSAVTNDGESITQLMSFADKILQFKTNSLLIINVSGDYDYLESEHRFMGISHIYQSCMTEIGPAWVNKNGCFLYDGEKITNLITGKINPTESSTDTSTSWYDFIGQHGMISYLEELKQILVFSDPSAVIGSGYDTPGGNTELEGGTDVMVYDIMTGSWTRGQNKVTSKPKSNPIMNYDNKLLYMAQEVDYAQRLLTYIPTAASVGIDAVWQITGISQDWTCSNFSIAIGAVNITASLNYPTDALEDESFRVFLKRSINEHVGDDLLVDPNPNLAWFNIIRRGVDITESDTYANNTMAFTNAPTASSAQFASKSVTKESRLIGSYVDVSLAVTELWDPLAGAGIVMGGIPFVFPDANDRVLLHLCTTEEITEETWDTAEQYPMQTILFHCHMDPYYVQNFQALIDVNEGEGDWAVSSEEQRVGILGPTWSSYRTPDGNPIWINPDRVQIYLTPGGGGNFSVLGNSQIKFDLSLHHLGFHEATYERGSTMVPKGGGYFTTPEEYAPDIEDPKYMGYLRYESSAQTGVNTSGLTIDIPNLELPAITNINEDQTINGTGDALNLTESTAGVGYLSPDGSTFLQPSGEHVTEDIAFAMPSTVFRHTAGSLYITILGNQTGSFSVGSSYTISGATVHSENNFGGNALVLNESYAVTPSPDIVSGQSVLTFDNPELGSDHYSAWPVKPATWWSLDASVTVLRFVKSNQSGAVQALWDGIYSYGEHATVTFSYSTTTLAVSNSGAPVITGVAEGKGTHTMHPRRNAFTIAGTNFVADLAANSGTIYNSEISYVTVAADTELEVNNELNMRLTNVKNLDTDAFDSNEIIRTTAGTHIVVAGQSGLQLQIPGDYTNILKVGDLFKFIGDDTDLDHVRRYRIKTVGAYSNPYTLLTIASVAGDPWGGMDSITAFTPIQTAAAGTASGEYTTQVEFSCLKIITHLPSESYAALGLSGWCLLKLGIYKFTNGYNKNNESVISVVTRDADFDSPASGKVFYKVIFSYKSSNEFTVDAAFDGSADFSQIGAEKVPTSSSWSNYELYFNTQRLPRKAKSIQLKFSSPPKADAPEELDPIKGFEINDITIVYRSL
jgi:hypothetical protein